MLLLILYTYFLKNLITILSSLLFNLSVNDCDLHEYVNIGFIIFVTISVFTSFRWISLLHLEKRLFIGFMRFPVFAQYHLPYPYSLMFSISPQNSGINTSHDYDWKWHQQKWNIKYKKHVIHRISKIEVIDCKLKVEQIVHLDSIDPVNDL